GLGNIGLAPALPDPLLVALHGEGCHRDDGNGAQLVVFLEPFGHFQAGNLRKLDIHQDQVGTMRTRKIYRVHAAACPGGPVAAGLDQVAEDVDVELVVLDVHHLLGDRASSGGGGGHLTAADDPSVY